MIITKDNAREKLLTFRNENKKTQEDIAEKVGISVQTISNIENGNIKPQAMTLFKLNQYFMNYK